MTEATREPSQDGPTGPSRWSAYLDWMRDELGRSVLALSDEEQRRSRVPSGWSPIELLSHCLHMEQRWFVWGFLGEDVDDPWGDWSTPDPWTGDDSDEVRPGARWQVADGVAAVDLVARLHEVGARTREVLASRDLAERAGPWFTDGPAPDLEWICFHVVTEYARHLGHLDIVVELGSPAGSPDN